ncbi:Z-ring formation inhibitor MciZ [Bacillus sp. AK031]
MKVIVHPKRIIISGKAWEVKEKLKEYSKQYKYVEEWTKAAAAQNSKLGFHRPSPVQY